MMWVPRSGDALNHEKGIYPLKTANNRAQTRVNGYPRGDSQKEGLIPGKRAQEVLKAWLRCHPQFE